MPEEFDPAYWEARYRSHPGHGVRGPSPHLVAGATGVAPGRALDVGCGEGANALWLAEQGWQVTALDVSATALVRARAHADHRGADVAGRITWVEADVTAWEPHGQFDLVTAHYVHPSGPRAGLLRRLADAVDAGGTLLVVDHDRADEHAHAHAAPDDITSALEPGAWTVEVAESRVRQDTGPGGRQVTLHDAVVRARRRRPGP